MGVKITDKDNGYRRVLAEVKGLRKGGVVSVGIWDGYPHVDHDGHLSGMTTAAIGTIHEFGLGHVPERSFIRAWVDLNEKAWLAELHRLLFEAVMVGKKGWGRRFGSYVAKGIKARIRSGEIAPPLAASTVARKRGPDIPLIDTGCMLGDIKFKVEK